MKIKVCGLAKEEDAILASQLGAWALGFVFYPKSPRYISPQNASRIIQKVKQTFSSPPICFGVVVNEDVDQLQEIKSVSGVDVMQLHGDESPELCQQVQPVAKAFRLKNTAEIQEAKAYQDCAEYFLLDAAVAGKYGGTGQLSDWGLFRALTQLPVPCILSGGLSPDNIEPAWQDSSPFALDLSSGIEVSPGVKDHEKLRRLFKIGESYGILPRC